MNGRIKTLAIGLPLAGGITAFAYFHDHQINGTIGVAMFAFGLVVIFTWGDAILGWAEPLPRPFRTAIAIAGLVAFVVTFSELRGDGFAWPAGVIAIAVISTAAWLFDMALMIRAKRRRAREGLDGRA